MYQAASPPLRIEAPAELASLRAKLESMDAGRFADIARLVGLAQPGGEIQVKVLPENSEPARNVPPWVAGFALESSDVVVLFPARSPTYPDSNLEDVLRHEITHILISRASGRRDIPRWFDEGLAMAAERERRFEDQTQLLYQLVGGSRTTLTEIGALFHGGQNEQTRAYALAGALVHDIFDRFGSAACGKILRDVREGMTFDNAFQSVTGVTPDELETEFWNRQRIWMIWVPILGSSATLWLVITALALLAIYMRRRRDRQIEERWAKEDEDV